jgi:hypothetical protein
VVGADGSRHPRARGDISAEAGLVLELVDATRHTVFTERNPFPYNRSVQLKASHTTGLLSHHTDSGALDQLHFFFSGIAATALKFKAQANPLSYNREFSKKRNRCNRLLLISVLRNEDTASRWLKPKLDYR